MTTDPIIECVPNFSEGRNKKIIESIQWSIESVPGVKVLHIDMGYDAHRTVITFIGSPEACKEAAYRSIHTALDLIDMRYHHGAHPRLGAVDVYPFVPLQNTSMETADQCAQQVAVRVAQELPLPIYLYNESARIQDRRLLATVRQGEYESLPSKLKNPAWSPDVGACVFNPRSGALIIGARKILIAFNINLETKEVGVAKQIAGKLREKNGGLKKVRAIGWYMDEFKCSQVSTNLVDIGETPLHKVFERCTELAAAHGTKVTGSELVGLIPMQSLLETQEYFHGKKPMSTIEKIKEAVNILGLNSVKTFDENKQVIELAYNKL